MGRYVSLAIDPVVYFGSRDVKPGFGTGAFRFFGSSGTFLIPSGVSEVRVTALGGGGTGYYYSGCCTCIGAGGGGAGYVVATTAVTAGCLCNVAVGSPGGGTSCFGTAVYAYGGSNAACMVGGAGGSFCVCSGTLLAGRAGNSGCAGCTWSWGSPGLVLCGIPGGASGSPIGGSGTGPFPGTSGADFYSCKGFNGEDLDETALAAKFSNLIRWPGETIISTSRRASTISGTAAGFPVNSYAVSSFGGGAVSCGCGSGCGLSGFSGCIAFYNAGCGGGNGGGHSTGWIQCYCNFGYGTTCQLFGGSMCRGAAGAGLVVVEY